jgi:hypothetical protein
MKNIPPITIWVFLPILPFRDKVINRNAVV